MTRALIVSRAGCIVLAALLASFALIGIAFAGPVNRRPFVIVQPDGTTFLARGFGDEWSNGHETTDGFTILRDSESGFWVYADRIPGGPLVATALAVGRDSPLGLTKGLRADAPQLGPSLLSLPSLSGPVLGTRRTLVILVQFANKTASTTASEWHERFFGVTGSVKDYYAVSSYGQVAVDPATESHGTANDGIVGWVTLATDHPNTAGSTGTANQRLTKDAVIAADPYVNYSNFDTNGDGHITPDELMVIVIAAGNETSYGGVAGSCSPSLWGHRWAVYAVTPPTLDGVLVGADGYAQFGEMHCSASSPPGQIATIGIMAHEVGHLGFGLPDLYDTDGSSEGIGSWSLMASGSWNYLSRHGDSPSLLDAWSRSFLGWVTPTPVTSIPSRQSIPAAATDGSVFQFLAGSALTRTGEYFLLENRQKTSYDAALPGSGLLIWHIDEAKSNNNAECIPGGTPACSSTVHYKVALIQADGLFDLERAQDRGDGSDPFPGSGGKSSLTDSTSPSSRLWDGTASTVAVTDISGSALVMTATLSAGAASPPGAFNKTLPLNAASGQLTSPTLSWGASPGATRYEYCIDTTNDNACSAWTDVGTATSAGVGGLAAATTYCWQVRATGPGGTTYANAASTAFWSFTTVASVGGDAYEPDNTAAQAKLIAAGSTQPHTFHLAGDVDWVRFSATVNHQYTLTTSSLASGVDTVLYLYDSDGTTLLASDDDGGGGFGSRVVYTAVGTRTLYARVVQCGGVGTGSYTLDLVDSDIVGDLYEPDNAAAQAKLIAAGSTQAHTFHVDGDVDWVRFSATAGARYTIATSNLVDVDTVLYLYGSDGTTLLASDDDGGGGLSSQIVYTAVATNTLYARVVQYDGVGTGSYLLGLAASGASGDPYEPDNTPAQSSLIAAGGAQAHTFHIAGDVDWVRFPATVNYQYTLTTSSLASGVDTVLYLYDSDGTTLLATNDDGGGGLSSQIVYTAVAARTLYAKVVQYGGVGTGSYLLGLAASGAAGDPYEPDDAPAQAKLISVGTTQARSLHTGGDVDWVRFSVTAGRQYAISTSGLGAGVDTVLSLYGSDGATVLAYDDDGGGGLSSRIVYTAVATGTLYAEVLQFGGAGTGSYLLELATGVYFSDDMEGGDANWTPGSPWSLTTEFAHGGTHAWSDSPAANYGANLNVSLVTRFIDLSAASAPGLTFWHRRDLADDGDSVNVWVTTDGGQTFTRLATFTGSSLAWTQSTINLTAYAGQASVRIYFQLLSNGTGSADGWYIDDVAVREATTTTPFDFTGDVKADVLWRHATQGDVWLWPMDGAARTAEQYVRTVADTNWEIPGVADFTGDGKADILWRNKSTGAIYLWPMNGSAPLSETYVATVDPAYDIVGTGDFNGDGKSDMLWRHLTNGEIWIWLMDGATALSRVYVGTVDPAYVIKGVSDLDGDGKADIVWHHATAGEVWVWLMDGATPLSRTWVATVSDVGYQIQGVADYDGDGKTDILWHHATRGEVWLWRMDGATRLAEAWAGTVPDTGYRIVGTGDYDGDGKADVLWRHATAGEVWVWLMDGATRLSQTWVGTVPEVSYQIVKGK
jgi:M6 family metalloprotease-like protein